MTTCFDTPERDPMMMAQATRFNAAKYAALTVVGPDDKDDDVGLPELHEMLGGEYAEMSLHKWRARGSDEGGYGPVGMPAPAYTVTRGAAAGQPRWKRKDLERWLIQTGRENVITFKAQQPRRPGRGRNAAA